MANEIRLRSNNQQGTISDNPLAQVSTTINSPGFVSLPIVDATNHLLLILDPLEVNGEAEIVQVTAHTAAASSVTVTRGFEGSVPRAHILGTTWFHGPVESDYNYTQRTALSTNRPASPFNGELIYETDTNRWAARSSGGVWLPSPHNVPACRVFHNANQLIPDSTITALIFNSERYDTDTMHDTVTNNSRITFKTPGVYNVSLNINWNASATGHRILGLRLNGTTVIGEIGQMAVTTGGFGTAQSLSTTYKFAASDYLEGTVLHNQGGNFAVLAIGNWTPEFSATWVGVG